ncbi:ubiquinone biosynthesis O-methyltransferase [Leucogyrophana mollusca]|uniref:Ubiquinone biosynthesis O-methyltransferase n=1 Tax=Leucogyrophana mollusca TaxID=85980 RepID=A0ACB8BKD7_9AGAM|nr:ubiquinone biosynthesis O-methyltransferase [Leucogyrophana mollusca]
MFSTALRQSTRLQRSLQSRRNLQTASTVNAAEIAHFSRLSSLWWDEHGEFAFLHRMNPVRMQFVRDKLLEIARDEGDENTARLGAGRDALSGLDVLDVGCGGGLLSESLARLGARTLGIDASESNIGIASLHASADPQLSSQPGSPSSSGSLQYRNTSAEELLKDKKRYDVVCSMEVIEHVDNPPAFLSACAELVKPGGHLFLSTIARTPLSYLLTIVAAEYVLRKVAVGTHTYSKFVNPSELVSFFREYHSPSPLPSPGADSTRPSRPWITRTYDNGLPTRTEAEIRGLIYVPWKGDWVLMPRSSTAWGAAECNYMFWVRKPAE